MPAYKYFECITLEGQCSIGPHCVFCESGLKSCTVCGGAEITLTTECVGRKLTERENELLMVEKLDYRRGKWRVPKEELCPDCLWPPRKE